MLTLQMVKPKAPRSVLNGILSYSPNSNVRKFLARIQVCHGDPGAAIGLDHVRHYFMYVVHEGDQSQSILSGPGRALSLILDAWIYLLSDALRAPVVGPDVDRHSEVC